MKPLTTFHPLKRMLPGMFFLEIGALASLRRQSVTQPNPSEIATAQTTPRSGTTDRIAVTTCAPNPGPVRLSERKEDLAVGEIVIGP